jgi:hypothetical protein
MHYQKTKIGMTNHHLQAPMVASKDDALSFSALLLTKVKDDDKR